MMISEFSNADFALGFTLTSGVRKASLITKFQSCNGQSILVSQITF
ncbi:MAG: hypothetical protein U9Q66_03405 [Patescibacteria group bacterium]|nr:hypothetical protein [Patescibacteria group bacterium]